jgi:Ino eighty subunit 1
MAFLWLMWFYLESDFTEEGCEENPFGPGVDYGLDVANQGVPQLKKLTDEELALENKDTEEEIEFGRAKQKTRAKILEMDQAYLNERETKRGKVRVPLNDDGPAILPRIRPSKHESDMDSTRSTPPPRALARGGAAGSGRRGAPLKYQIFEGSSPAHHVTEGVVARKPRPPTAHQLAVERNRSQRVEYILDRGLRRRHHKSRKLRRQNGAVLRAYKRLQAQVDPFEDSEGEGTGARNLGNDDSSGPFREKGLGGLCLLTTEEDDFGEEVSAYAAALRRSSRRLARWYGHESELGVIAPIKRQKQNGDAKDDARDDAKEADVDMDADLADADGADADGADADGADPEAADAADSKMNGEMNGDVTMDDAELDEGDQTIMAEDEGEDPDKTEVMGESDGE